MVLNGGSSSGVTSLARAAQVRLAGDWLLVGVDVFLWTTAPSLLAGPDGLSIEDGVVVPGARFSAQSDAWRHAVATLARRGADVLVDDVFVGAAAEQRRWEAALEGVDATFVALRCEAGEATRRERARGDRQPGMAAAQADAVHAGVRYDVQLDSTTAGTAQLADELVAWLVEHRGAATTDVELPRLPAFSPWPMPPWGVAGPGPVPATRFTALVGCRHPLQQAAMGGVATPALAATVSACGGLGMLAGAGRSAAQLRDDLAAVGRVGPVGVGFLGPFLDHAAFDEAAQGARLVELVWSTPDAALVARAHDAGALVAWQVGTADEARAAADAGCDLVVAQGVEAGGHVRGTAALLALLDEVVPTVEVPVVAAGGIATGRAVAAALAAGADAVRVGTRFVATLEADAHPAYQAALVAAGPSATELTTAFSLGWPDAPHRTLRAAVEASDADPATRSPLPPARSWPEEAVAAAALYAGQGVGAVRSVVPAAEVVDELVRGAAAALARLGWRPDEAARA